MYHSRTSIVTNSPAFALESGRKRVKVDRDLKLDGDETPPALGAVAVDGVVSKAAEARISPFDAAVLHGDAFFETMRVRDGRALMAGPHLKRLLETIAAAGYHGVPDRVAIGRWIDETISAAELEEAVLRVTVSRGARPGLLSSQPLRATCLIYVLPLPRRVATGHTAPMRLKTFDVPGYRFPRKSASYQRNVELYESARSAGFDEALIVDGEVVIEGSGTNVLAFVEGRLVTPPAYRCLPGITRAALLEVAPSCGLEPVEQDLDINGLMAADAVLLCNSLVGIRQVGAIDEREVAAERETDAVERLRTALREIEESS
jgi:branched-subunit amino acid aminotransferase/4-amino-4-deoxychorismate lyase